MSTDYIEGWRGICRRRQANRVTTAIGLKFSGIGWHAIFYVRFGILYYFDVGRKYRASLCGRFTLRGVHRIVYL